MNNKIEEKMNELIKLLLIEEQNKERGKEIVLFKVRNMHI